jgi:serine-type D-Ala-D-Ala endopeptidase (penicillin-binding protein 7)
MFNKILFSVSASFFLVSIIFISPVLADSQEILNTKEEVALKRGIAQIAQQDVFSVGFNDQSLKADTSIVLEKLGSQFDWPWNFNPLSEVYQFDFSDKGVSYDRTQPLKISIKYEEDDDNYKQIMFYDGGQKRWRPLPSVDDPVNRVVSANIHLPFARVALMSNDQVMTVGQASWYRFKGGLFAASPDFAKGSVLKVTNLANGKSVNITINDYGPDRKLHPDRVIDLDAVAFSKIADIRDGLVKVKIEPVKLVSDVDKDKLYPGLSQPDINAHSAVVISAEDGLILYAKNADKVASLASLTKLVAMKVFLDTKSDLNKVVAYSIKDAEYNHEHVKPWESARLRLVEGETLTIENLLYASLVGSANNTTETLVRVSGLSRSDFIKKMNDLVKEWGAFNTVFVEPTGLAVNNVSSPLDYAIITRELLKDSLLMKISATPRYSFNSISQKKRYNLTNTNSLLTSGHFGIISSKTGFLNEAGYCLMTSIDAARGPLIVVNFGSSNRADSFYDNEKLIRHGLKQLSL